MMFLHVFGQQSLTLIDSENGTPISFAHVKFRLLTNIQETNSKELWITTDESGKIIIPYRDSIEIEIRHLSYNGRKQHVLALNDIVIKLKKSGHSLEEIVVTGSYLPGEIKESVYDIKTIGESKISRTGATNLREAINTDLNIRTNNGHVNETAITMNGLSGNHVKLMIDGVPIEGRMNGNIDLSQINLDQIEKIEIIDGPVSVLYGSNALAGTINLITKKNCSKKYNLNVKALYETVGQYNFNVTGGIKQNSNNYKVSIGRNYFDGFNNPDTSRFKTWKPREQYFGSFTYFRTIKHLKLSYILDAFQETMISKGIPRAPYYTSAFDTWYNTKRLSNKILLNGRFNKTSYCDITASQYYFNRIRNLYFKDLTNLNQYLTEGETDQDTTTIKSYLVRGVYIYKNDNLPIGFTAGVEYKQDEIESARVIDREQQITDYACFVSSDIKPIKALTIRPGMRYVYNTKYNAPLIPSVNILYAPVDFFHVKASYAKGYRSPDMKELFMEFHYNSSINIWGNTNLIAENSDHANVMIEFVKKIKTHEFLLTPKVYYSKIRNLISVVQISDVDWKYTNSEYLITKGASLNFSYNQPFFNVSAGYNYNCVYNSMFNQMDTPNKYFSTDNINSALEVKLEKVKMNITINYKYCGKVTSYYKTDDNTYKESSIGEYQIFDLSLTESLIKGSLSVTAGVKNLMDTKSVKMVGDIYGVSAPSDATNLNVLWGRTGFISLKYNL